jgi:hypothetical protein
MKDLDLAHVELLVGLKMAAGIIQDLAVIADQVHDETVANWMLKQRDQLLEGAKRYYAKLGRDGLIKAAPRGPVGLPSIKHAPGPKVERTQTSLPMCGGGK